MAARNADVPVPAKDWTRLTDGDIASAVTIQSRYPYDILLKPTSDTTKPTNFSGSFLYRPGAGELRTIEELCPGVAGADNIWAWCTEATLVTVSHAAS